MSARYAADPPPASPVRARLFNRRASESFALECDSLSYVATISRFADGRLGEIFLSNHKAGSAADTAARDGAIVCSIALQYGADLETIRKALCRDSHGRASGPLGVALDLIAGGATKAEGVAHEIGLMDENGGKP